MASPDDKRDVLSHSHNINKSIEDILQSIQKGCSLTEIEHEVIAVKQHLGGVQEYLSKTIEPQYYAERRSLDSTTAMKVFKIPELFEFIVLNLGVVDLMGCYGVCRAWKDTIANSTKLQTALFLRPNLESEVMACRLPQSTSDVKFVANLGHIKPPRVGGWISNQSDTKQAALPVIGSRWRGMLIAQPPIRKAQFWVHCSIDWGQNAHCLVFGPKPYHMQYSHIESGTGITLGDVHDEAERLFEAHKDCPKGSLTVFYDDEDVRPRSLEDRSV